MLQNKRTGLTASFIAGLAGFIFLYLPVFSRPTMVGIVDHDYFNAWQLAVNSNLREGQLLHWMFWLCGGQPGLANPQSGGLSPFNFLGLFFSPALQFKIELIINAAIGLVGFLLLGKRTTGSYIPGLLGFVIWAGNGLMLGRILHGQTTYFTLLLIPFAVWVLVDAFKHVTRKLPAARHVFMLSLIFLFIIYQDGFHVLIYTAPVFVLLTVGFSMQRQQPDVILLLVFTLVITSLLSLPRLLPVFDFLADYPRTVTHIESVMPLTLMGLLLDPDQLLYYATISRSGTDLFRLGYLGHVGLLPMLLCLFYFILCRNSLPRWPLLIILVLASWLAMGAISSGSIWSPLSRLPLLENIRAPFKFIASAFLVIAMTATLLPGYFLSCDKPFPGKNVILLVTLCIYVALTLLYTWSNWPLLKAAFKDRQQSMEVINSENTFTQREGDFNNSYPIIATNTGLLNCYEPTAYINHAGPDRPLVMTSRREGRVSMTIEPNRINLAYELPHSDTVIINQNYHEGWRVESDEVHDVIEQDGLLGVVLPAGKGSVILRYESHGFKLALNVIILLCIAMAFICMVFTARRNKLQAISRERRNNI